MESFSKLSIQRGDVGLALKNKLKQSYAKMLLDIITAISGAQKDLVLDPELIACLDHFASITDLKSKGVEKVYKLEPALSPAVAAPKCVYITRPHLIYIRYIADHINSDRHANRQRKYCILFVPQKVGWRAHHYDWLRGCSPQLYTCELILEQEGVLGWVEMLDFPLGLVPLDSDLYSLETPLFHPTYFLLGDSHPAHHVALSLMQLQEILGPFATILGQGLCAKAVIDKFQFLQKESTTYEQISPLVDTVILLDRDLDYVSLFLSQLTYQGLLDEILGIRSGKVTFNKDITGSDTPLKYPLNSTDPVFREIADLHFTNVFSILKDKGKLLQDRYQASHSLNIGAMRTFVGNELKNLKHQHKSLALHVGACEFIMSQKSQQDFELHLRMEHSIVDGSDLRECQTYVQECIIRQQPLFLSLRLLCLLSICQGGLRDFKSFVTDFLQSYGHHHLVTISNLQRLGILTDQETVLRAPAVKLVAAAVSTTLGLSPFRSVTKKFALIPRPEETQRKPPSNPSYVFGGGYVPLLARVVDLMLGKEGVQGLEEQLRLLPGPTAQHHNRTRVGKMKTLLVYVLGGLTFAELSALRMIGSLRGVQVLVACTALVNGNSFLGHLIPSEANPLVK